MQKHTTNDVFSSRPNADRVIRWSGSKSLTMQTEDYNLAEIETLTTYQCFIKHPSTYFSGLPFQYWVQAETFEQFFGIGGYWWLPSQILGHSSAQIT